MVSNKLQNEFKLAEMAIFETWRKSNKKDKEKITKALGEWEGKKILEEIDKEVKKIYGSN